MKTLPFVLVFISLLSCSIQSVSIRPSFNQEVSSPEKSAQISEDTISPIIQPVKDSVPQAVAVEIPVKTFDEPMVRVLLHKNQSSRNIFIFARAKISSPNAKINISAGELRVSFVNESSVKISAFGREAVIALPCTLSFIADEKDKSRTQLFSDDEKEYRGGIIFTGSRSGFCVINYIRAEDYLRGVVPLEIGVRNDSCFEALKAQAVAARTYTLARVLKNIAAEYDLLPTVADQVYGGYSCEYALSDLAIKNTDGIVITDNSGTLINAYYHATCGGTTAAVNEVWQSSPDSTLISRSDSAPNGVAFCSTANSFLWREEWSIPKLSQILQKYSRASGEVPFDGTVQKIFVNKRSQSGRVAQLSVVSENGTYIYGKDKCRFVLRMDDKSESILRSSKFDIAIVNNRVVATGTGYGHGIGMCQNGAIARARAGQDFMQILRSYYMGIEFSQWFDIEGAFRRK